MTKIINALTIQAKVEEAFDEFRTRFNPERLYQAITDLATMAGRSVQFCPGITNLVGDEETSLQAQNVDALPLGTTVTIRYNGSLLTYTLTSNDLETIAPYIIRVPREPGDAPRTWVRSGAIFTTFGNEDLDETHTLALDHSLGFPFCNVLVFNSANQYMPNISFYPDPAAPANTVKANIGSGFEGTWSVMITY
jgi:hypothetical protein